MLRPKNNKTKPRIKHRPFLKWAGGKYRLTDEINRLLPKRKHCLVEPFVGAGAVFLNSQFERYILADINPDLIHLFNIVKQDVEGYIQACKPVFFHPDANTESYYYTKRKEFNQSTDVFQRAVLFLYLNRFGFNGLCRYNAKNEFNVPFGAYKTHYFPEEELRFFAAKAQSAVFLCADFQQTFELADKHSVIYCDPPYLHETRGDTKAYSYEMDNYDHIELAKVLNTIEGLAAISNYECELMEELYPSSKWTKIYSPERTIHSTKDTRQEVLWVNYNIEELKSKNTYPLSGNE